MHSWFRFYHEVVDDPKVQTLTPYQFRAWVNLLCIAAKHDGVLPEMKAIGYRLHVTEARAEAIVDELAALDLFEVDNGLIRPHNWNGRQFQSDSSNERVKRFRDKRRNVTVTASVTDPDTDTESETDTEQNQKPPNPLSGAFASRWAKYPDKDGRKEAERHWNASVKDQKDLDDFDKALANYMERLKASGYRPKTGKTFFNNWRDFIDWKEPENVNDKRTSNQKLREELAEKIAAGSRSGLIG